MTTSHRTSDPEQRVPPASPRLQLDQAWPYRLVLAWAAFVATVNYFHDFVIYPWKYYAPLGTEAMASAGCAGVAAAVCLYSGRSRTAVHAAANRLVNTVFSLWHGKTVRRVLSVRGDAHRLPSARVILAIAVLAATVVALDLVFNLRAGLLTVPPIYDGISYMMDAKRLYLSSHDPLTLPSHTIHMNYWGQRAYLWQAALAVSYTVFGAGEWQSYTARWWPIFFYLLLVYWIVRKRASRPVTVSLVFITALLPLLMPCVRGALWDLVTGRVVDIYEWYQDDLRPDLMFTVLISVTAALLLESGDRPDGRVCALAGVVFGLSLFAKPTAIAEALLAAFVPAILLIVRNRRNLDAIFVCAGGFVVFGSPLFYAFVKIGGIEYVRDYLTTSFTRDLPIYRNASETGLNALPFYATIATYQLGHWEWLLIPAGLVAAVVRRDVQCLRYYLVGAALLLEIVLSPSTNFFLSYGFLLLLWMGTCLSLASLPALAPQRVGRAMPYRVLYGTGVYCMALIIGGFIGLQHRDVKKIAASTADRNTLHREEQDVVRYVGQGGQFAMMNQFGIPATMEFDWLGKVPDAPQWSQWYDPKVLYLSHEDPIPEWRSCRAVLVYAEPMPQVSRYAFEPQAVWPVWDRLRADLTHPGSQFHLVRTYHLSSRPLTVQLWVSDKDGASR